MGRSNCGMLIGSRMRSIKKLPNIINDLLGLFYPNDSKPTTQQSLRFLFETFPFLLLLPPSNRQHLSCGDCMEGKRERLFDQLCAVVHNNCAHHMHLYNERFVHGRLDQALILLGLAVFRAPLCLRCTWCYM